MVVALVDRWARAQRTYLVVLIKTYFYRIRHKNNGSGGTAPKRGGTGAVTRPEPSGRG